MEATESIKGDRIRQLRLAKGMTQAELASATGDLVSKQMVSRYERDQSQPSPKVLQGLAEALEVKTADLFRQPPAEIEFEAYRRFSRLGKRKQRQIERTVERELEKRIRLQDVLGQLRDEPIPANEWTISGPEKAEQAAEELRDRWELGRAPIASITEVLEDQHIHVIEVTGFDDFDGLSALAYDNGDLLAAAVVYHGERPGERQRLSLAHELAHLVLEVEESEDFDEEDAAYRMGAAFLAPKDPLIRDVGKRRQSIQLQELLLLKEEYGMSIQALLYRLNDLEVITDHHHRQWSIHINKMGWRKSEPEELPPEKPKWLRRSVYRAYSEGLIAEEEAERLIGESPGGDTPPTLQRRRSFMDLPVEERRQVLQKQADEMEEHYQENRADHVGIQSGDIYDYGDPEQGEGSSE
jgi:transcriptional regulator with XRE-family HTH domain